LYRGLSQRYALYTAPESRHSNFFGFEFLPNFFSKKLFFSFSLEKYKEEEKKRDEMALDISPEETIQICNNFLLSSPPGEFLEVVTDVRALLADDSLINDTAPATFREYNTDQMLQVQQGDHIVCLLDFAHA
jgi:F-actin capping protein alpha subunit